MADSLKDIYQVKALKGSAVNQHQIVTETKTWDEEGENVIDIKEHTVFIGSLQEIQIWIDLKERGYLKL